MAIRLTDRFCESAKSGETRKEFMDALVPGLALVVQPTGKRSWAVRYRMSGKPTKVTLGPYPLISLGEAREQAREVLQKVAKGQDVAAEKRTTKSIAFTEAPSRERDLWPKVLERYLLRDAASLRSHDAIKAILERETKDRWANKLIRDITKRDVVAMVDSIVDRGSPIAANRALAHTRRVFAWALGRDLVAANPCDGIAKQPEKSRDRVLTRVELADIWAAAEDMAYPFGRIVQMLMLTGQRLREVAEAEWTEFDLAGAAWTIPPDRAKNDERHVVPLSPAVLSLLADLPRLGKPARFLFTTTTESAVSGFNRAKQAVDRRLRAIDIERAEESGIPPESVPPREHWTFHDIRRSVATGMAEIGIMADIVERVLNHKGVSRTGIRAVYQRFDHMPERRAAMLRWATEVEQIVGIAPAPANNVRQLKRSAG
ncbi:tyrosine-type recombinase/integrase [Bosea sp. (in: a-proteobacteria)]|uniref:tyrosine-type recombinase/integrase n=1 Tax=Bosea sp. (in: a-proteobacteria) TaxID=1871050 RepID=UPI003B3A2AFD